MCALFRLRNKKVFQKIITQDLRVEPALFKLPLTMTGLELQLDMVMMEI